MTSEFDLTDIGWILLAVAGILYFLGFSWWVGFAAIGVLVETAGWLSLGAANHDDDS